MRGGVCVFEDLDALVALALCLCFVIFGFHVGLRIGGGRAPLGLGLILCDDLCDFGVERSLALRFWRVGGRGGGGGGGRGGGDVERGGEARVEEVAGAGVEEVAVVRGDEDGG